MLAVQGLVDAGTLSDADAVVVERIVVNEVSLAVKEMMVELDLWRRRAESRFTVSVRLERARQRLLRQVEQLLYTLKTLGHDYLDEGHSRNCAPCQMLLGNPSGGGA